MTTKRVHMKKTKLFMEPNHPRAFGDGSSLSQVKRGVITVALVAIATGGAQGAWMETFDSYASGSSIIGQGAWVGWEQVGTDDAIVTNAESFSASNSLQMGGASTIDLVPQITGATSGIWNVNVMTYVPSGSSSGFADVGFLARHKGFMGAPDTQWFGAISLNMATGKVNSNDSVDIIRDQWVPAQATFDIDARTYEVFYNGTSAATGNFVGNDNALVGLDVYTPANASTMYFDNFSVVPEPASLSLLGLSAFSLLRRRRTS